MKTFFVTCFVLCTVAVFGQVYQSDKINPRAVDMYERALAKLRDGEIKAAIPMLQKAYEMDNHYADAILSLAGAYAEIKDYQSAITQYEKGRAMDSVYFRYFNISYSINLAGLGKFDQALDAINRFLAIPELNERSRKSGTYRKRTYEFGVQYAQKKGPANYVFSPRNLGDSVNSTKSEYYPSITINDSLFVFTRRGAGYREDFIESTILPDKTYTKSKIIDGDINIEPSKGAINISQDGEWLLFAGYNFPGGLGDFDLYTSYYTPKGWSEPVNMGASINSDYWDSSPSLSPDKKALYFSSNRPGGYGGKDLYVSYRQANGRWSAAVNMGPDINTGGDELAPFIHADNATLYFTSDGLPGYGGSDIYLCRKGANNRWSIPENLGYPINTIENEGSLFVAANGKTAYYASDRSDSRGGLDLYTFELREDVRPAKTLYVQGKVYDKKSGKGIPSTVELIDNSNHLSVSKVQTDETGNYFMALPVGKDYSFSVNRRGYLFFSEIYALSKSAADSTYNKDIPLQPVEINASVILRNVLFETNSAKLQYISLVELNKLLQLLEENPALKVQINGHSDNVGKVTDNINLSTSRAKTVVDYLTGKGVDPKRLSFKGLGSAKPIADNNTEQGRAQNRRTEVVVISNL